MASQLEDSIWRELCIYMPRLRQIWITQHWPKSLRLSRFPNQWYANFKGWKLYNTQKQKSVCHINNDFG